MVVVFLPPSRLPPVAGTMTCYKGGRKKERKKGWKEFTTAHFWNVFWHICIVIKTRCGCLKYYEQASEREEELTRLDCLIVVFSISTSKFYRYFGPLSDRVSCTMYYIVCLHACMVIPDHFTFWLIYNWVFEFIGNIYYSSEPAKYMHGIFIFIFLSSFDQCDTTDIFSSVPKQRWLIGKFTKRNVSKYKIEENHADFLTKVPTYFIRYVVFIL